MRLDSRITVPELLPAFQAYAGSSLRPFFEHVHLEDDVVADCAARAVESRDAEGLRLARLVLRLSREQRSRLRAALRARCPAVGVIA